MMAQNPVANLYTDQELAAMAACLKRSEAIDLETIRVMLAAGHPPAVIRCALKISRRTWFRRWKRFKALVKHRDTSLAAQ